MNKKFDIAIIGSGIAGASLATILARQGKKVIVFEAKEHPRFAIGESMILESSEVLRAMAELNLVGGGFHEFRFSGEK